MKGSSIGLMPVVQSRESQKTGLEYDEIDLAVFDLCFYTIFCSVLLTILDKCDFLNPWSRIACTRPMALWPHIKHDHL